MDFIHILIKKLFTNKRSITVTKNKVYVGNLPWSATQEDLQHLFGQAGTVTEVKIIMDRDTGKSKGFAFITFEADDHATRAISEFDTYEFQGRPLRVSIAENKPRDNRDGGGKGRRNEGFNNPRTERY